MSNTYVEYKSYPVSRFSSVEVQLSTTNNVTSRKFFAINEVSGLRIGADDDNEWQGTEYPTYNAAKDAASHLKNHYGKIERAFN